MIDLTNAEDLGNDYGGSEAKKTLMINNKIYLVKFPDPVRGTKCKLSYINNQFSEYIGCNILKSIGLDTQNTFLATYDEKNGKHKIVVACEDFCYANNAKLKEFKKLAVSLTEREENITTSFEFVNYVIENCDTIKNKKGFKDKFWDMFVGDALIGNPDRHLENFGLLQSDKISTFAPIYDCGSALSPLISDEDMEKAMEKEGVFSGLEYNIPSVFKYKGKRVFYHEIFKNPPSELVEAIERVVPNIHIFNISDIINNTEGISAVKKNYLKHSISMRYEKILKPAYRKLQKIKSNVKSTAQE